jgi:hypothetical protein
MQDVGCPEPAAVVDIIERMLKRFAFCLMASIVAADGAVAVVAVIRPLPQVPTLGSIGDTLVSDAALRPFLPDHVSLAYVSIK